MQSYIKFLSRYHQSINNERHRPAEQHYALKPCHDFILYHMVWKYCADIGMIPEAHACRLVPLMFAAQDKSNEFWQYQLAPKTTGFC